MRNLVLINPQLSPGTFGVRLFAPLALLAAVLCGPPILLSQSPVTPSVTAHKKAHSHKRPVAAKTQTPPPQPAALPVAPTPLAPDAPLWPANEKPSQAKITWDSKGLRIEAANSSLLQILKDVATVTGAKVQGLDDDQRVYGAYGPGKARDVLSQLLQGSGYNVVMIGDQGQGTPREILLTSRHNGSTLPVVNATPVNDEDADTDEPPPQPIQPPIRSPFAPSGPVRSPQQMQQEMQQRQQQMQQRPQPQPPANPQN